MLTMHKATVLTGLIVSGALLLMALGGCGGGSGEPTGLLQVGLTDAEADFESVWVSIREIRVVPKGVSELEDGPFPLVASFNSSLVINIMDLQYQQQLLGEGQVPLGQYGQVRLVLDRNPETGDPVNYVIRSDDTGDPKTKVPLKTPSGQQSGLKILGQFEVAAGQINAIVLDFDPSKAIVVAGQSGQTLLKPTGIRITQVEEILASYGCIVGTVMPELAWGTALVSVVPVGETAPVARGSVHPGPGDDGGGFRACVPAGDYYLVVTAVGYQTHDSSELVPPVTYNVTFGATIGDPIPVEIVLVVASG